MSPSNEHACIIFSTYCSNRCVFCGGIDQKVSKAEMRRQEINAYKNIRDFKIQGYKSIEISGSDPLEYDKIGNLIRYLKGEGFDNIQLSTNGVRLSESDIFDDIVNSGLDRLRIPIYGSRPQIHDSVTKVEGSFEKTMDGVRKLKEAVPQMWVQASCLIMNQNKDDLIPTFDLMRKLKVDDLYFSIPCIANEDYSFYLPLKDLGQYVRKLANYARNKRYEIRFSEIPYCVFSYCDRSIENINGVPELGKYNQPPKQFRTEIHNMPSYRLKTKVKMCSRCKAEKICAGFFVNDIKKYGTGNLKPLSI